MEFKVTALTYKIRSTSRPAYLQLAAVEPHQWIHGDIAVGISAASTRTRTVYGSHAFSVAAPSLWNSLPADITNAASLTAFRNRLKTFLFHHTPSGCSAD